MSQQIQDFKTRLQLLAETPLLKYPSNSIGGHPNYDKEKVSQFIQLTENIQENELTVNLLLALRNYLLDTPEEEINYQSLEKKFSFIAREIKRSFVNPMREWTEWVPFEPSTIIKKVA